MKSLLSKDDKYQITENWVRQFRKVLFADFDILLEKEAGVYFWHDGVLFSICDNGLEFNLETINFMRFESIPYVRDKKSVDAEDLALKIVGMVKDASHSIQKATSIMNMVSKTMKEIEENE